MPIEDFEPCYLPDGGMAFISTRSQQFGRCHGLRYVPSYTLYRCELDGTGIRPLSLNEANEWKDRDPRFRAASPGGEPLWRPRPSSRSGGRHAGHHDRPLGFHGLSDPDGAFRQLSLSLRFRSGFPRIPPSPLRAGCSMSVAASPGPGATA